MPKQRKTKHFYVPDTQVKPDVPTDHIESAGNYCAKKKPDVIVFAGDFYDMPSLSSYDKRTAKAEGRRYSDDIKSGNKALTRFFKPILAENRTLAKKKKAQYKPRLVVTLGNHEERIMRHINANPELVGQLGYHNLAFKKHGFEVYNFLEPVIIDGIVYSHFFPRNPSGKITQTRNGAPNARTQLQRERMSCTAGHAQGVDFHIHHGAHRRQYGLIAGSFYMHEEDYLSPQGTNYWRGCIMKHQVEEGEYDPMFLSLEYLLDNY